MFKNTCLGMFSVIMVTMTVKVVTTTYLGSVPTKAYFFPWLVTFHRYTPVGKEFFGSGSIITKKWVIGSMDCFIRPTASDPASPYYRDVGAWEVHSGGIWANVYERSDYLPDNIPWLQIRKVAEIRMPTDPEPTKAKTVRFSVDELPNVEDLNSAKRSPFGLSMSMALVKVEKVPGSHSHHGWDWKRTTLPIPLSATSAPNMKKILEDTFKEFEASPSMGICHVGGWRPGDWRLVEYEVIYVPFDRCRDIFCANDDRACFTWPVQGVHVCFKSMSYTDPCWRDQGSALFCTLDNKESVVGVLTSAPTCGSGGLPGVFTLVDWALNLLSRVAPSTEQYEPISKKERNKYTPPPKKKLILANTLLGM